MVRAGARVALAVSLAASGCLAYHELRLPSPTSARPVPAVLPGLRAGFGRADITPPPGVGLAGNGPEGRRAAGYRAHLYARALLLEDRTGERIALLAEGLQLGGRDVHALISGMAGVLHGRGPLGAGTSLAGHALLLAYLWVMS